LILTKTNVYLDNHIPAMQMEVRTRKSKKLVETSRITGKPSHQIERQKDWLGGFKTCVVVSFSAT